MLVSGKKKLTRRQINGTQSYTLEKIIRKLREAEVFIAERMTAVEAAPKISFIEVTYYHRQKGYSGMRAEQMKRDLANSCHFSSKSVTSVAICDIARINNKCSNHAYLR